MRIKRIASCPIEEYDTVPHDPHESAVHAALAVARYLNVAEEVIQRALLGLAKPAHLRAQNHAKGHVFIDCSYNSNAEGFIAHMHMLRSIKKPKKIILTSGIIELGKHKKDIYNQILLEFPPHTAMYTSDKMFKNIARTSQAKSIIYHASHAKLTTIVEKLLDQDSAILIEGRFRSDYIAGIVT